MNKFSQRQAELDHLFEIGLVLLGILSAAEFEYSLSIENEEMFAYILRVCTVPFIILILFWLVKEIFSDVTSKKLRMILTDFCWSFWGETLLFYLLFLLGVGYSVYILLALSILLVLSVANAYDRASAKEEGISLSDYLKGNYYSIVIRWIVFLLAYLLLVWIVWPH